MCSSGPHIDAEMKRSLSTSLYWYVEKSLDDMLDGFMLLMKKMPAFKEYAEVRAAPEIRQIITQMLELPLEFDNMSRQLSVNLILGSIQRNITSTKACTFLLCTLLTEKSEIVRILKGDCMTLLEQIFFREVKNQDYIKPKVALKPQPAEHVSLFEEEEIHPKLESRAYAEILVELYEMEFIGATQVLVYMEQLSKKKPSYYHTDLLLFLLSKVGNSVEKKLSRENVVVLNNMFSSPASGSSSRCRSTFEGIYERLESFMSYAISTESQLAYSKILKDRKKKARARNDCLKTNGKLNIPPPPPVQSRETIGEDYMQYLNN